MGKTHSGNTRAAKEMAGLAFALFFLVACSNAEILNKIGVNYGRLGSNLPSPYESIEHLKSMKAGRVKIYDANPEILKLLSGTNIYVAITVPNSQIISIASNQSVANSWVRDNIIPYYPETMIRFLLVGNEVFSHSSDQDKQIWQNLVPAMRKLKSSLASHDIRNIKIGTPLAMDVLRTSHPPSSGTFRSDIAAVMVPLLKFLNSTNSYFCLDVYPYFAWSASPNNISLDFALFTSNRTYTDPSSQLKYANVLDMMLDSVIFAMTNLGYPNIKLLISETGWPNAGDVDQHGANIYNAATYNRNLVKRLTSRQPVGTPARRGAEIPTFLFALFDENQKPGAGTERHWGLLRPSGQPVYEIDLTGNRSLADYPPLPAARNNRPFRGKLWCVVVKGANLTRLRAALDFACNHGNGTCDALTPGNECYDPVSLTAHADYAFSSYYAKFRSQGATCYFNGLAELTTKNPSRPTCQFPSATV
ncbi:hypothetical protein Tsubulata_002582 [Turnera subulata]|uniref:glucan endo-1,3-beta-D-glucosidase n=1 Tax=Turnera subulata TaxID=218843 RepID=A0A9Q0JMG4_9ROSI|nr:hypothetical protein Tsubulata_002582 [Turnera subulata]